VIAEEEGIMKACIYGLAFAIGSIAAVPLGAAERTLDVTQGPETVFDRPVAEIVPALEGATATGENGRVGNELVFWSYRLADGRPVYLFACARLPDVNCEERIQDVCLTPTTVLDSGETSGKIVRRQCREIAVVAPGDTRPGCIDTIADVSLAVGLVSCG
jgi:hypothetical protein